MRQWKTKSRGYNESSNWAPTNNVTGHTSASTFGQTKPNTRGKRAVTPVTPSLDPQACYIPSDKTKRPDVNTADSVTGAGYRHGILTEPLKKGET